MHISSGYISEAGKFGAQGLPVCRSFTLEELKEATNNFDNSAFLGEGSYGKVVKPIGNNFAFYTKNVTLFFELFLTAFICFVFPAF